MIPKVSVIVPVYKVETTLRRCVDSILGQTFKDFELLLIDDGSPDGSGAICDEYAATDSRVRVFHKANGGVSSARNLGLDNARGEWISFVDSDDYISSDFMSTALQYDKDIVILGNIDIIDGKDVGFGGGTWMYKAGEILRWNNNEEIRKYLGEEFSQKPFLHVVWGRLFKHKLFEQLRFDSKIRYGEDTILSLEIMSKAESMMLIQGEYYYYFYFTSLGRKYKVSIEEASYCLSEDIEVCNRIGLNSKRYFINKFKERLLQCYKGVYLHPIRFFKAEGFKKAAKKIDRKHPHLFMISFFIKRVMIIAFNKLRYYAESISNSTSLQGGGHA